MSCDFVNSKGLKNTPSDEKKKKENKKEHEEEDKRVKQEWREKKN